ncbi:hypothetical protein J6G99_03265 [bacterium]|nr:hypothetical protein [bacterium]
MKKIIFIFLFFEILFTGLKANAIEFNLLVLPTNLFSVCDNYFCFPEVSNIVAEDIIDNMTQYKNIHTISLAEVRKKLFQNPTLKHKTENVIGQFAKNEKIDFASLKDVTDAFGVKSALLITSYTINDKTTLRRNLWDILEVASAFGITYPFELKTSAVLTDNVNNIVMWSGKYSKEVSDSEGYYSAKNQTEAISQLEKIKEYSKNNVSQNISQNVFMRFFPREVRTFTVSKPKTEAVEEKKFIPNALDKIYDPRMLKQFNNTDTNGDIIFAL